MAPLACSTCGRSAWQQAPCHKIESFAWPVCLQVCFHHNLVPELCLSISHITSVLGTARRQSMASSLPFSHTASKIEIKSQHCPWVSWLYNSSQSSKMRRRFLQRTGGYFEIILAYSTWSEKNRKKLQPQPRIWTDFLEYASSLLPRCPSLTISSCRTGVNLYSSR